MGCLNEPTTKDAYRLSITSLIATLLAAIGGFFLWKAADSSLSLVFGLENLVDFFSSAVVLWRFFAPAGKVDAELEKKLRSREEKASIAISFVLVILGIGIVLAACIDFSHGNNVGEDQSAAAGISLVSAPVFMVLTYFKFRFANRLDSESLYKDGICSLIGLILSIALLMNTIMIKLTNSLWWMDPLIALLGGIGAFVYGIYSVHSAIKDGIPVFSSTWWARSQGGSNEGREGTVEMAAPKGGTDDDDGMVDVV